MTEMTDELVVRDQAPVTLFGPTDPTLVLERMSEIATALVDVINQKHLYKTISGRKHILVEGWTTLGAMLGVTPHVVDVRPNETGDGYIATVEARTLDGRIVGTAQAECSRSEKTWANRDSYAIRSMAQTRAISRTLRAALGMVVVFAGYEATPAEEMPADDTPKQRRLPKAAAGQLDRISNLLIALNDQAPTVNWKIWAREIAGVGADKLDVSQAASLIHALEGELAKYGDAAQAEDIPWPDGEEVIEAELNEFADPVEDAENH